jgi:ferredoxin-type protein NapG
MSNDPRLSRRDLLRGRLLGGLLSAARDLPGGPETPPAGADAAAADAPSVASSRYHKAFPVLRPPGAVEEQAFLAGCTRCAACIDACPHHAIVHAPLRFRRAAGTPMIDPIEQPCWMCRDYPCIAACEPGVLRFDVPVKIGVARIDTVTCLAYQGTFCTVCSEQCPVDDAIETAAGRPRIVEAACTGCGVCQHVCPAPHNAVLLMPVAQRPAAPGGKGDHGRPQ